MEPTKLTDTLKYIIIAMLLILASQGIAQSSPKTDPTHDATYPNTEIQEQITESNETIHFSISLEDGAQVLFNEDEEFISTEAVTYFKVRRIVHKTKFAEERVVRKSYLA